MSSNPSDLARINHVKKTAVFPRDKDIIVPVNCSCNQQYYQAITSYQIQTQLLTYFVIANITFQGLTTCGSLKHANVYNEYELKHGFDLKIPLRCACPTKDQILNGTKYLLTYRLTFGDTISFVAQRFNVSAKSVLQANEIAETNTVFAFTTLLIPLQNKPSISETIIQRYNPTTNSLSPEKRSKTKKSIKLGVAGVLCSCIVFTFGLVVVIRVIYMKQKGENEKKTRKMAENKITPVDLLVEIASFERVIKVYSLKELQTATENFDNKFWIKGSVYKGMFGNQVLAVKKVNVDVCKQVNMLSKINHINLVKLYGYCKVQDSWYLVFEYMKMGTVKEWLKGGTHSLRTRVQIAIDVANGLRYLHTFAKPGYVHNNLNTNNILLDGNLRAKISNFSLARMIDDGNDDSVVTRIMGARGYIAPEYLTSGMITSKVDVYAYGVVLLELITGKDAVFRYGGQEVLLATEVSAIMKGENAESEMLGMIDLENDENGSIFSMDHAIQVVKLSLNCLKQDPENRPSMDEIVSCIYG
ncbi:hypothetical protein QVD17_16041 [Tagetes erecta]|uniref:Uncharacterized protein n=1 Tax=Tagetes erecta TaxID=13708 RepID=A0AAD8KTI2_TARER|nr:hypothetical protein QVD17_16041 [Tagetes erecta]